MLSNVGKMKTSPLQLAIEQTNRYMHTVLPHKSGNIKLFVMKEYPCFNIGIRINRVMEHNMFAMGIESPLFCSTLCVAHDPFS